MSEIIEPALVHQLNDVLKMIRKLEKNRHDDKMFSLLVIAIERRVEKMFYRDHKDRYGEVIREVFSADRKTTDDMWEHACKMGVFTKEDFPQYPLK